MATKKSKSSTKPAKAKTTKQKTAVNTEKITQETSKKTEQISVEATSPKTTAKKSCFSGFFAKKYEENELSINTLCCVQCEIIKAGTASAIPASI